MQPFCLPRFIPPLFQTLPAATPFPKVMHTPSWPDPADSFPQVSCPAQPPTHPSAQPLAQSHVCYSCFLLNPLPASILAPQLAPLLNFLRDLQLNPPSHPLHTLATPPALPLCQPTCVICCAGHTEASSADGRRGSQDSCEGVVYQVSPCLELLHPPFPPPPPFLFVLGACCIHKTTPHHVLAL